MMETLHLFILLIGLGLSYHMSCASDVCRSNETVTCDDRLGVEDGRISDNQLTASTQHSTNLNTTRSRLNGERSWSARTLDVNQWLQVDFNGAILYLTGVILQGRSDYAQWVTKYSVQYSLEGVSMLDMKDDKEQIMVFTGNTDQNTSVTSLFPNPINATSIRIIPLEWHSYISLRAEIIGCDDCNDPLGLTDNRIPDGQLTASTAYNTDNSASKARLGQSNSWSTNVLDQNQWIKVILNKLQLVTGVITQGFQDWWIKHFKVEFTDNPDDIWHFITDAYGQPKVFSANTDGNSEVTNMFPKQVIASVIRLRPTAWNVYIRLRMEILGCPVEGTRAYRFSWFKGSVFENPLEWTVCCENQDDFKIPTYPGSCLRDLEKCKRGFAISLWLKQIGTTVGNDGSYFLSTGAQRSESCGFYVRLNAVNASTTPPTGVFDVGVSTTTKKWQVLFVAQLQMAMHLIVNWKLDKGLDIYIDGQCAGTQIAGFPRAPTPTCGSDDSFPDFYVGRRNDIASGYGNAQISRLNFYLAWKNPTEIYTDVLEGTILAYYQGCIDYATSSSILSSSPSGASSPSSCRSSCLETDARYFGLYSPSGSSSAECFCIDVLTGTVDDTQCSTICAKYMTATCGSASHLSVYLTSAFENSIGAEEPIQGFSVELVGFDSFTFVYGQPAQIRFSTTQGTNIDYFVYGDSRVEDIETSMTTTYMVCPSPGTYVFTAVAVNAANRLEYKFNATVLEDSKAIKHLSVDGGIGEANATSKIAVTMVDGEDVECHVAFGDGTKRTYGNAENTDYIEHMYASTGVYNITLACASGYTNTTASTSMLIVDKLAVRIESSFLLSYGDDLVVSFVLTGFNISEVNVTFDIEDLEETCDSNWNCQVTITSPMYDAVGTHVLAVTIDNILGKPVSAFADVNIGHPIDGFIVDVSKSDILITEELLISINISKGSHVYITFSIEDVEEIFVCPEAPCSYAITAVIPGEGFYRAEIEATNDFAVEADNVTFMVYQPIRDLTLTAYNVTTMTEEASLQICGDEGNVWPNDATVYMVIAETVEETPFTPDNEGCFTHSWSPSDYGVFTIKANVSNPLQYTVLQETFQVGDTIQGLSIDIGERLLVETDIDIIVGVTAGNPVTILVYFGDGRNVTIDYELQNYNPVTDTSVTHRYDYAGTYKIDVISSNIFGLTSDSAIITVHRAIEGIYLGLNVSVTSPGEHIEVAISMEESALIPWNASCTFNFGDGTPNKEIPLTITPTSNLMLSHTYTSAYGDVTIHVQCANQVSIAEMTAGITVILPVTNCALSGPLAVSTDEIASFQIHLKGSHFELDIKEDDADIIHEEWDKLNGGSEIYTFETNHQQPGVYAIGIRAHNQLGTCESNATLKVLNPIAEDSFRFDITPDIADHISDPTVSISINLLEQFDVPSEVMVYLNFGDGSTVNGTYPGIFDDGPIRHAYISVGTFRISALLTNLVSELEISDNAIVMENVGELKFNTSTNATKVEEDVFFVMSTTSGTNLTYLVSFGDGINDSRDTAIATHITFTHRYASLGRFKVKFTAVNQLGRVVDHSTEINVVTPIEGLTLRADPAVVNAPGRMALKLSQDTGYPTPTDMDCTVNLGDGSDVFSKPDVDLSTEISLVNKLYFVGRGVGGEYDAVVSCNNPISHARIVANFKVYEPLSTVDIQAHTPIAKVKSDVMLTVRLTSGSFVTFIIDFGDSVTEERHVTPSHVAKYQEFIHRYQDEGHYQIKVSASNGITSTNGLAVQSGECNVTITYGADVFTLTAESSTDFVSPGDVQYKISVIPLREHPKKATLVWWFGDGTTLQNVGYFNGAEGFFVEHDYDKSGIYTTTVEVSTLAESQNYTATVTMQDFVPPLTVIFRYTDSEDVWYNGHGPDQNWMPVRRAIKFFANTTLEELSITWSFGDGTSEETSDIAFHEYSNTGWYNITISMWNTTHTVIEEYFDLFIVEDKNSLTISAEPIESETGEVWVKTESVLSLESENPTGPACIAWATTDSWQVYIYGPAPCAEHVSSAGIVFIETDIESTEPYQHRHTFVNPGHYKIVAAVENYATMTNVTIRTVVIVKGCSEPIQVAFKGTGQILDNPREQLTSEMIPLDPVVSFPCVGIDNPEFEWSCTSIQQLPDGTVKERSYDIEPLARPKRLFEPLAFNPGLYEIKLTVSVHGFPNYTGMDSIFLKVEASPLVLSILGGTTRSVGTGEPVIINAISQSYNPDNTQSLAESWLFTWSCFSIPMSYAAFTTSTPNTAEELDEKIPRICDSEIAEMLDYTEGQLVIDGMMLRIGYRYQFTVTGSVSGKTATAEQLLEVEEGVIPSILIRCVTNCKGKMNPTSSFGLQGSCANCLDDVVKYLKHKWTLYVLEDDGISYNRIPNLSMLTSTGDAKAGMSFFAGVLDSGKQYRLRLAITQPDGSKGFTEYTFMTNLPPYNGTCSITPQEGAAITTDFTVHCIDWTDEGNNLARPLPGEDVVEPYLQYRVLQRPKGSGAYYLMSSSEDPTISNLVFATGPQEYNNNVELKVHIVDKYGAKAEAIMSIKVVETVLNNDDLDTLVGSNSSYLQQLVAAGDAEAATQLITAVLSVLTDQDTSSNSSDITGEEVKEIQSALLEELSKVSIWASTIDDLYSAASALSQATQGNAHAQALFQAALTMAAMAQRLESVSDDSPEEVMNTATGLTDALGNLMSQSESIVNDAKAGLAEMEEEPPTIASPEEGVDEYAPGALDPELAAEAKEIEAAKRQVELEGARFAAKTIGGITKNTLNSVADVLCSQLVSGQPPAVIDTGTIQAEIFLEELSKMAGREIKTKGGSIDLPEAGDLFPNLKSGNVRQKELYQPSAAEQFTVINRLERGVLRFQRYSHTPIVLFYQFNSNPYPWYEGSADAGSEGALGLDFEFGIGEPVEVQNLTREISITLYNGKTKLEPTELVFWNTSVHHKVEVTSNDTDLRLIVKPSYSPQVKVFVKYGEKATVSDHDYEFVIPRNLTEDESWTDADILDEAKYSVLIPSSNGTGAGFYYLSIVLTGNASIWDDVNVPTAGLPTAQVYSEYLPTVDLTVYAAGCRYWDNGWTSDGCRVGPLTNSRYTQCLCTHLSEFTSSFFVPPNSIDFSTVFLKFKNLGDNAAVFSTVFALFGVYLILVFWLRRKDKQDVIKWGVTPLADNNPDHKYYYQITVETGMRPGSGTESKVGMIISSDLFDTGVRIIDDSKRKVFTTGSVCHFLMSVDENLGPLSYLKIWHDNSGDGDMAGWYLSKVAVLDIQTGEQSFFICERWMAVEQDDGAVDRLLPVASKADMTQFAQLFYSGSREKLFDDHLWFSLFSRPTRSHFTRVQRLSCCLSLLYCSMIANAMFYRTEETVNKPTAIRLGPFSFTLQQFFVGFISALVVMPINVAIVQIFRKSKPSKKDRTNAALPQDVQEKLNEVGKNVKHLPPEETDIRVPEVDVVTETKESDNCTSFNPKVPMETIDGIALTQNEMKTYSETDNQSVHHLKVPDDGTLKSSASAETLRAMDSLPQSRQDLTNITPPASPCHSLSSRETAYHVDIEEPPAKDKLTDTKSEKKKKKEEFMLPHWCVYIAWFLFASSCFVSAFFTILYSLEWGKEKSSEWLSSMMLSFVNSVVFIQPVKVLVIVTLLSLIFKKPSRMDADTDSETLSQTDTQLNSDEELLHGPLTSAKGYPYVRNPPSKTVLEAARKRRFKELRMYSIIRETLVYSMYVTILLFLAYSNRDSLAFFVSKSIRDNFVEGHAGENTTLKLSSLSKSTPDLFWNWMEKSIIPGLYGDEYYNGEPMHWRHTRFLSDFQNYRVGPARLRQLRVKPDICKAPRKTSFLFPNCREDYNPENEEEGDFSIGWSPPRNVTYKVGQTPEFIPEDEALPWQYQNALDLNGVPYPGKLNLYGGGGFVSEFGVSMDKAFEIARFLKSNNWYDDLTRAIFLEFTVYNANTNLFSVAQILIELPSTGGGFMSQFVHTFRLYHYYGGMAIVSVVLQLLFAGYIIYFTVKLIMKLRKEGRQELASFWTFVELLTLLLSYSAVGLFAIRQIFIYFSIKEVKNKNEGRFVNFAHIAKWDELFGYMMAFLAYLAVLRYMRLLRLSPRMCMFGLTMQRASSEIICFGIMFGLTSFAFSHMAFLLFSPTVYSFSTILTTMETLFAMMLGSFEFEPLVVANRIMGPIFFVVYILSMFFILSNMFVTLISEAFGEINEESKIEKEETGDDTEMVDFMMEQFKNFLKSFSGGGNSHKHVRPADSEGEDKEEENAEPPGPMDLLESRLDHLLDFIDKRYGPSDIPSDDISLSAIALKTSTESPKPSSAKKIRTRPVLVTS